jgi:hypothetical protein
VSDRIPDGIRREHIEQAIAELKTGDIQPFHPSTRFELIGDDGQRYPPKAVLGFAAKHVLGQPLRPQDFKGGKGSKWFRVLEGLGFDIRPKRNIDADAPPPQRNATAWVFQGNPVRPKNSAEP